MTPSSGAEIRYGVIGLGIMGRGMAAGLAKLSMHPVIVWNRSPRVPQDLPNETAGARATPTTSAFVLAGDPADVGRGSEIVFAMLATGAATERALTAPNGLLAGIVEGTVVVNCATVGPDAARALAATVEAAGAVYLDAPVLGSRDAAATGQLTFLVAGDGEAVTRCGPAFEALGRRTVRFGAVGSASAAKLVFNALLGTGMAAAAEACHLGAALGLDRTFLLDVVLASPVVSAAVQGKRDLLAAGDDALSHPQFPLKWMLKDLDLALDAAGGNRASLSVIAAARDRFDAEVANGRGDHDFSAVARTP
jgi:3-hydroxyisobutyrate dehydrogenase-like beta-hydroxyacid dehydrogenase